MEKFAMRSGANKKRRAPFILFFALTYFLIFPAVAQQACIDVFVEKSVGGPQQPRVVVISGTNRRDSRTLQVAQQVRDMARQQGLKTDFLDIAQVPESTYSGDAYFNTPVSFQENYDAKINEADAVVIVMPEYHGAPPGVLLTFLNYVQANFAGKPVMTVAISAGALGGQKPTQFLAMTLTHRKARVDGRAQVLVPNIDSVMNGGRIANRGIVERIDQALAALVETVRHDNHQQYLFDSQINTTLDLVKGSGRISNLQFNSGVAVKGNLADVMRGADGMPIYLRWQGPTELRQNGAVISGQGIERHTAGFSCPVGKIKTRAGLSSLSQINSIEALASLGIRAGESVTLHYASGVKVQGVLAQAHFSDEGTLQILEFSEAEVTLNSAVLYERSWGPFDLLIGEKIVQISMTPQ